MIGDSNSSVFDEVSNAEKLLKYVLLRLLSHIIYFILL
jgi:hypothetical protein